MRSLLCFFLAALLAIVMAIPITPSAPGLQRRAEQFRLQGLNEFQIAERLSASAAESESFRTRINHGLHSILHTPPVDGEHDLFAGDIPPGSLDAPSILPKASSDERSSFLRSLCAMFRGSDRDLGYEGKESELRRPSGMHDWAKSYGGFRRR